MHISELSLSCFQATIITEPYLLSQIDSQIECTPTLNPSSQYSINLFVWSSKSYLYKYVFTLV